MFTVWDVYTEYHNSRLLCIVEECVLSHAAAPKRNCKSALSSLMQRQGRDIHFVFCLTHYCNISLPMWNQMTPDETEHRRALTEIKESSLKQTSMTGEDAQMEGHLGNQTHSVRLLWKSVNRYVFANKEEENSHSNSRLWRKETERECDRKVRTGTDGEMQGSYSTFTAI